MKIIHCFCIFLFMFYFDIVQNNRLNLLKLQNVYILDYFDDTNIAFDRIHSQLYMFGWLSYTPIIADVSVGAYTKIKKNCCFITIRRSSCGSSHCVTQVHWASPSWFNVHVSPSWHLVLAHRSIYWNIYFI